MVIPPDLSPDSYLVLGVAHCFYKAEGDLQEIKLIEPIPSASLETLCKHVPTAYAVAGALPLGRFCKSKGKE